MKKSILFIALAAGMLAASCTKTVVTVVRPADESPVEQKLIIGVSSGKDALTTKAGRPLLSQAAGQDIQNISLYFVPTSEIEGKGTVVLIKNVTPGEWENAQNHGTQGKQLEITLKKSNGEELADGTYDVYAVGYSTEHDYTLNQIQKGASWDDKNFYATATGDADEIFAGKAKVYAKTETDAEQNTIKYLASTENGGTEDTPSIILNRQVAGVTGYFTNIPAKVNDKVPAKLRLVASNKFTKLNFVDLYNADPVENHKFVVNGSDASSDSKVPYWDNNKEGYILYEINLSEWFVLEGGKTFDQLDINGDGYVGYLDAICHVYKKSGDDAKAVTGLDDIDGANWSEDIVDETGAHNKLETFWKNANVSHKQQLVAGSVFAGKFVIPFTSTKGVNTLELQLLDASDNILTNWNVRVPSDELYNSSTDGSATGTVITLTDDTQEVYNIYRNHMYSLGSKGLINDNTDAGEDPDPSDPDPDPKPEPDPDPDTDPDGDHPQDLTQNNLLIHVNDQWEIIHHMEID